MNEYMCRNFVAQQIISDMSLTRLHRRLGASGDFHSGNAKSNMIEDEGSSNYQNWLSKLVLVFFNLFVVLNLFQGVLR